MRLSIKQRLIAVTVFAALACAAALFTILHLVRTSREQRIERGHEVVAREIERLRDAAATHGPLPLGRGGPMQQSGYLDDDLRPYVRGRAPLPIVRDALRDAAHDAVESPAPVVREVDGPEAVWVVGVQHVPEGGYAWAVVRVPRARGLEPWRFGVLALALATLALVAASMQTLVAFRRGATTLERSIDALRGDLGAKLERPSMRELADVSDGIASLANDLLRANERHEVLTRELAARERLASLGRVSAGLAHEVRNPLASIKLRVDLALRGLDAATPLAGDLRDVSAEIARLDRLVADLLTVAGRRTGPRRATDMTALARTRASLLEPWASERSVRLEVRGEPIEAVIDADAISRAIDNLARNAVEASSANGTVTIALSRDGTMANVFVEDRGRGVPPDRVAELFEPFFTTKPEGTGLGLALTRAIAEAHGGTLTYARDAGISRFALRIPIAPPPEPP